MANCPSPKENELKIKASLAQGRYSGGSAFIM